MLPQALEQASDLVSDLVEAGRLRSEKDQLEYDVRETLLGLETARIDAEKLYIGLNQAASGAGRVRT
ncbi:MULTISPECIES: hypothetical protein [Streptomyces]|uniref:Uncharacterized protein n=1 Tax=Streptomyces nymphaeiformis TaxID=2663842 RepID=A0A7W7XFW2_9ACTN|nr:hypothetical protein [Streptomyces nymphaeiformis]MBB4986687.1 hypothetical protein [Streptomyces nymphaeiformis]